MYLSFAFLKKYKDSSYYDIINILNLSTAKAQFLMLDQYDLAFRIDKAAIKLYEHSLKDKKIVLVNLDDVEDDLILPENLLILDFEEFKNTRKNELKKREDFDKNDFIDDDLYYEYIFEEEKKNILLRALGNWFPAINMIFIMYTFDYIEAQLTLFSRGYMINDDNKEDIFIEIIEKDEDDLIEVLEKYIEAKDELQPIFNSFKFYKKLKEEIDEISYWDFEGYEEAKTELNKIVEKFQQYEVKNSIKGDKELFKKIINEYKKRESEDN